MEIALGLALTSDRLWRRGSHLGAQERAEYLAWLKRFSCHAGDLTQWFARRLALLDNVPRIRGACLDVGCGRGIYAEDLLERGADFYVGVDLEPTLLIDARQEFPNERIHFLVADAEALPLKDSSFSFALCTEVIEHVVNPRSVPAEIFRVLHQGQLVRSVPSLSFVHMAHFKLRHSIGRLPPTPFRCCGPGGHLREYAVFSIDSHFEHLKNLFSELGDAGFGILSVRGCWVILSYLLERSSLLQDPFRFRRATKLLIVLDAFLGRFVKNLGEFTVIAAEKRTDQPD